MALWPRASAGQAGGRHGTPWRAAGVALVAVTALGGLGLVRASVKETPPPPQPAVEAEPRFEPTATPGASVAAHLPRSAPTDITISAIGVHAKIMDLGVNADGTLQVPPLEQATLAGWYSLGPSPGEIGNAVIVGHVSTAELGPTVFFELGSLRKKDVITIKREDGRNAQFRVDGVKAYPKKSFPTDLVYGPNSKPGLRLVTCGGTFDAKAHSYVDNVVVFATAL
ncbi:class F sortase [Asanoa sp. NPDC049573]|uniref:class F sortase n=1 Tax=Asanoa sp. NPDC049573 TaxID=3155396 RepID=UPI00343E2F0C